MNEAWFFRIFPKELVLALSSVVTVLLIQCMVLDLILFQLEFTYPPLQYNTPGFHYSVKNLRCGGIERQHRKNTRTGALAEQKFCLISTHWIAYQTILISQCSGQFCFLNSSILLFFKYTPRTETGKVLGEPWCRRILSLRSWMNLDASQMQTLFETIVISVYRWALLRHVFRANT